MSGRMKHIIEDWWLQPDSAPTLLGHKSQQVRILLAAHACQHVGALAQAQA